MTQGAAEKKTNQADRREEERRIQEILDRARQTVKKITKRELQGECVSSDVLNFRLRKMR